MLGGTPYFFVLFRRFSRLGIYEMVRCTGGRVLKDIPHLGIYKTFILDRGKSFKRLPSYRRYRQHGAEKHGFQAEIARFRHKKSIHDDLQWYADMM